MKGQPAMKSFLITFKPAAENPERGWPEEELQKLVQRCRAGERVLQSWRFHNRKDVALGDRVFLLLQGKGGPAIIGCGKVAGGPEKLSGKWHVAVRFESLAYPRTEVFANREDLLVIGRGRKFWSTQSSGVLLEESVGTQLEALVVGVSPKARGGESASNPDWTRDELILALNFYLQHRPNPPRKNSEQIRSLSGIMKRLGEKLFPVGSHADTFRNENSVYMKLMNFRRLDPQYTAEGKTGLGRGAKAEEEVWAAFAEDPVRCKQVAAAIVASLDDPEVGPTWAGPDIDDGIQEAAEGRLLTRKHIARERNRQLVESKRKQVMMRHGRLACEVCDFDFSIHYGERGKGFIECHHTKPIATFAEGHKTHVDDLALVCANCHRMIHRDKRWLSVSELRGLMNSVRSKGHGLS